MEMIRRTGVSCRPGPPWISTDSIDSCSCASWQASGFITAYTWTANDVKTWGKDPSLVGHVMKIGDTAMLISKYPIANKQFRA